MIEDYASDALVATEDKILAFRAGVMAAGSQHKMLPINYGEVAVAEWIEKVKAQDAENLARWRALDAAAKVESDAHDERWEREGSHRA